VDEKYWQGWKEFHACCGLPISIQKLRKYRPEFIQAGIMIKILKGYGKNRREVTLFDPVAFRAWVAYKAINRQRI